MSAKCVVQLGRKGKSVTGPIQCENCGAVLTEEDVFCGECGAPRPALAEGATPSPPEAETPSMSEKGPKAEETLEELMDLLDEEPPRPRPDSSASSPARTEATETGWRVAFVALVVLGVIACLGGLLSFLLFGHRFITIH